MANPNLARPHAWECAADALTTAKLKRRAVFMAAIYEMPRRKAERHAGVSRRTGGRYLAEVGR